MQVIQDDVADLLRALGLPDHARPESCHAIMQADIKQGILSLREVNAELEAELVATSEALGEGPYSSISEHAAALRATVSTLTAPMDAGAVDDLLTRYGDACQQIGWQGVTPREVQRCDDLRNEIRAKLLSVSTLTEERDRLREAVSHACEIIELGDQRLLAGGSA